MVRNLLAFQNDFDGHLFILAKEAAKRAFDRKGTVGEEVEAATAIVLCAVVTEAAINRIGRWFELNRQRPPFNVKHQLPHGFYEMELRVKWSLLPTFLRQRTFDRGAEPWQSFEVLVELRNYILHLKSRSVPKMVQQHIAGKFDEQIGFGIAEWACHTVTLMFDKLTELVDPPAVYKSTNWIWHSHYFPLGLSTPGDPWPRQ